MITSVDNPLYIENLNSSPIYESNNSDDMSEPHAGDEPSRFRVNRIQSSQLQNTPSVVGTFISTSIPEDLPITINVGGSVPMANNSDGNNEGGDGYPNQHMRPRR